MDAAQDAPATARTFSRVLGLFLAIIGWSPAPGRLTSPAARPFRGLPRAA